MLTDFGFISIRWIWVALVVIFALIEIFTLGLTTVWFALSALVMVFLSLLPLPLPAQVLIFLAISALLLIFTRPVAVKKLKVGRVKTNVESLVGRHVLVTKKITEFEKGEVKLDGKIWAARSEDNAAFAASNAVAFAGEIAEGTKCEVVKIEGVTVFVRPLNDTNNQSEV